MIDSHLQKKLTCINEYKFIYLHPIMPRIKDENKIQAIYQATLALVLKSGYAELNMAAVAKEAGIATGSIYTYFKNKEALNGWWNTVKTVDVDNDGDLDVVLGNHGLNSRFRADEDHPIKMFYSDFDANGSAEGVMTNMHEDGKIYPYALRHNLMARLPGLKKKYPNFDSFKNASIEDIFTKDQLKASLILAVNELRSLILINEGKFVFPL